VQDSLTGAGFDIGDLRLCRFREFVDGLRRDEVKTSETSRTLTTHPVDFEGSSDLWTRSRARSRTWIMCIYIYIIYIYTKRKKSLDANAKDPVLGQRTNIHT